MNLLPYFTNRKVRSKFLRKPVSFVRELTYAGRSKKLRDFNCEKSDKIIGR